MCVYFDVNVFDNSSSPSQKMYLSVRTRAHPADIFCILYETSGSNWKNKTKHTNRMQKTAGIQHFNSTLKTAKKKENNILESITHLKS